MNHRRKLVIALGAGAFAAPLACFAQQQRSKVARIGLLGASSASSYTKWREALIAGLRELGYVDGKNISIEYRWAEGNYERLPSLTAELVQTKVDVIVAASPPAIRAAQQATTTIPIVMIATPDPVGSGFVARKSVGSRPPLASSEPADAVELACVLGWVGRFAAYWIEVVACAGTKLVWNCSTLATLPVGLPVFGSTATPIR